MKIVLFVINGLMNFKEELTKYLKQNLQILCLLVFASSALAQTHEVLVKSRKTGGPMVYESNYLEIQPRDTVKFIRKHKSHSAALIAELSPAGCPGLTGKIDEEIEVTYDNVGLYGIKCIPHYTQGMMMLIRVGDASLPESYRVLKALGIADKYFQEIYARVDKR